MKVEHPAGPTQTSRRIWLLVVLAVAGAGVVGVAAYRAGADPEDLGRRAAEELSLGHPAAAVVFLDRLARLRPPGPEPHLLRAQAVALQGRPDEAIADLKRIADGERLAPLARLRQGQIERDRNRVRYAEEAYRQALRLEPRTIQARRELIYLYGMQLRRAELRAEFLELAKLGPLSYEDVFLMCLSRGVVWAAGEASTTLARYLKADPADRASRLALVETLQRLNRFDEAESLLSVLPPTDPAVMAIRAQSALDRGDVGRTESILAGGPAGHPELERLRGRLALARRDWPAAIRHFRAVLASDPSSRDARRGLGQALSASGDRAAGRPHLDTARAYDQLIALIQRAATAGARDNPALLLELGDACRDARLYPEAHAWYQLANRRDPLDPRVQRALFELDAAEKAEAPHP